jgi:nucleoid-associated protein YgaU
MYTVRPGDCLWRIARSLLTAAGASPSGVEISDYWRSIYEINRDVIGADPNLIHPGQVFQLPER